MIIQHNMQAIFTNGKVNTADRQTAANAEKLSSGYRINRAADDAAGLSISEKMRSQIRGLNRASENIQDGMSLTNVADGALAEIHSILQRQRELLVQAANDTNTEQDRQAIEDEITALSGEFDRIFNDTEFNTMKIFKGEDVIVEGPDITAKTTPVSNNTTTTTRTTTADVWLPQAPNPNPAVTTTTNTSSTSSTEYIENVTSRGADSLSHDTYDAERIYRTTETTTTTEVTKTETYTPISDADYTNLQKPGDMVGTGGYINVKNVKGNLELSCAMSQLGVKVDGNLISLDLYSNNSIPKHNIPSPSTGADTVSTVYELGDGLYLTQTIALVNESYEISYSVENQGGNSHAVDVRLAFDTLNTPATCSNPAPRTFSLNGTNADIAITVDADHAVLGTINDLYSQWDDSKVIDGSTVRSDHTGVGLWWEGRTIAPNASLSLGGIAYGPITLTSDPYRLTTTTVTDTTVDVETQDAITTYAYTPAYIDIQAGSLARQNIPIMLYNLSSSTLNLRVPTDMSAFSADSSLVNIDRVIDKISSIRSYYGALTNRMEHAYAADQNTAENSQAAESRIRDLDMAEEMVDYSKNNILLQASQSMLAQSNQNMNRVVELLQI